jgi:hypothetical protein
MAQHSAFHVQKNVLCCKRFMMGSNRCRPKSALAQIFQQQRQLAGEMGGTEPNDEDDAVHTGTAATNALFALLPFRKAPTTQQRQREDEMAEIGGEHATKRGQDAEIETADSFIKKFAPRSKPGVCVCAFVCAFVCMCVLLSLLDRELKPLLDVVQPLGPKLSPRYVEQECRLPAGSVVQHP